MLIVTFSVVENTGNFLDPILVLGLPQRQICLSLLSAERVTMKWVV